jgi:phage terminase large subunit-like protein
MIAPQRLRASAIETSGFSGMACKGARVGAAMARQNQKHEGSITASLRGKRGEVKGIHKEGRSHARVMRAGVSPDRLDALVHSVTELFTPPRAEPRTRRM